MRLFTPSEYHNDHQPIYNFDDLTRSSKKWYFFAPFDRTKFNRNNTSYGSVSKYAQHKNLAPSDTNKSISFVYFRKPSQPFLPFHRAQIKHDQKGGRVESEKKKHTHSRTQPRRGETKTKRKKTHAYNRYIIRIQEIQHPTSKEVTHNQHSRLSIHLVHRSALRVIWRSRE